MIFRFQLWDWRLLLRLDAPGAPALFVPASSIGTTMSTAQTLSIQIDPIGSHSISIVYSLDVYSYALRPLRSSFCVLLQLWNERLNSGVQSFFSIQKENIANKKDQNYAFICLQHLSLSWYRWTLLRQTLRPPDRDGPDTELLCAPPQCHGGKSEYQFPSQGYIWIHLDTSGYIWIYPSEMMLNGLTYVEMI